MEWLRARGVSTVGMVMRNGSGLYDANRVSARQITEVLRVPWRDARMRAEFVAHLASAGEDGTLRQRLRAPEAQGLVRAKTGTLDDAIALSGFVLSPASGRTLVFSVLINGCRGRTTEARALVDALALALARHARLGR
jgi:D-alanyl-D-alanine carboxypeptidase/D-alanyl-D-alanine-endopeptidase (penicillin-binding protein 4)